MSAFTPFFYNFALHNAFCMKQTICMNQNIKKHIMKHIMKKNGIRWTLLLSLLAGCWSAWASPASPYPLRFLQPDGQVLTVCLRGDEHLHYYETPDGLMLCKNSQGYLCYATTAPEDGNRVVASTTIARQDPAGSISSQPFADARFQQRLRESFRTEHQRNERSKAAQTPGVVKKTFPTTGKCKGVIILAEFTDKKFAHEDCHDLFDRLANEKGYQGPHASGSIHDYFVEQSGGLFSPEFDVIGPVTLPHPMSYYGLTENIVELMVDASNEANKIDSVDFSRYDFNDDGTVDFLYVIYAGYSQAQGAPEDCIWPQSKDLTYESWKTYDGMYLGQSSCSSELHGTTGTQIDGIGTFCHEFSHILGLPDIYDSKYTGCEGMMYWDLMDVGLYNDESRTPAGFTAMDKYSLGWLEPKVLSKPGTDYRLDALSTTPDAYFLVCGEDKNEYFTFENRQPIGFDAALPGHGLLVSHVHYVSSLWSTNRVNTVYSGYEHVALVPADGITSRKTLETDVFPGEQNQYTTLTAADNEHLFWHQSEYPFTATLSRIREENGAVFFDFNAPLAGIGQTAAECPFRIEATEGGLLIGNPQQLGVTIADSQGQLRSRSTEESQYLQLPQGIYVVSAGGHARKISVK